jgi:diaminopimelate decarboxylase
MAAVAVGGVKLGVTRDEVETLARQHGDAFYLLDLERVNAAHAALLGAFRRRYADTTIAYSVKTNYTPCILARMRELGSLAEVVSELEYEIATRVGFTPGEIVVNGAVHRADFLASLLLAGVRVNLDGWSMLESLHEVSRAHPERTFGVGLRLSYPVPAAATSRFGFTVDEPGMRGLVEWFREHANCEVVGFHSHFCFAPYDLAAYRARIAGLAAVAQIFFPHFRLRYLDLGSGFRDTPDGPSFDAVAEVVAAVLADRFTAGSRPTLLIEPGTAIVGQAMAFVCRVYDVKTVEGRTLALVDGSSHDVNTMGWRSEMAVAVLRPPGSAAGPSPATFDVVGNTAMERKDHLCTDVPGPVAAGDYLVFDAVGSYSTGMKPPFIHPCPPVVAREGGRYQLVKRRETVDDFLRTYFVGP